MVTITTNLGVISLELYEDKAPITVKNFLHYVDTGYYTDTIFHRVVNGAVIQSGGYTSELRKKPTMGPIKNEATNGLKNEPMTIAMARKRGIDSAESGFFINVCHNEGCDHTGLEAENFGYCVFGKVIGGMDVVYQINQVETTSDDAPKSIIKVLSIVRS